ncbi:hypothetical protein HOLleu_43131 [Holothuria leucospilota]|uniref:Uncharacterized protein n=1 Tax=Holothuria leucospilota TaxID=206669 RepID=A0A9Q0Y9S6_HOLLE|nr:hypothetical protein HOLleu_43131 [Holothuria leucospilota]
MNVFSFYNPYKVCPPGLHLSLGLYLKHFNSFESACHLLDIKISQTLENSSQDLNADFLKTAEKYARARQLDEGADGLDDSANILIEHLATIQEQTTAVVYHQTIQEKLKERDNLRNEAESIRKGAKLSFDKGPLVKQLDATLQKFRVARQAYHGKSFVGNHVHRCCQKENIDLLMADVVNLTNQLCPDLVEEAKAMTDKYKVLFRLFGTCHKQYNTADFHSDEDIHALELTIRSYLQYFRTKFGNETIPPKMHILEDHVVPFIKKWHVGLGFLGEQGVESVHARLNSIKYNVRGLKDDLDILKSVMVTHWVQTRPGAHSIR